MHQWIGSNSHMHCHVDKAVPDGMLVAKTAAMSVLQVEIFTTHKAPGRSRHARQCFEACVDDQAQGRWVSPVQ